MEDPWVLTVRKILRAPKATVWIEDTWRPEKQRENDIGIMDAMVMIPRVNKVQLRAFKMWWVYMIVIIVSDMANVHSTAIPLGRMTGQWRRESALSWPNLPRPPPKTWEVFLRMMMKSFGTMQIVYKPGAEMPLKVKMGKWLIVERHILYSMVHDETACYENKEERWSNNECDSKTKQFR